MQCASSYNPLPARICAHTRECLPTFASGRSCTSRVDRERPRWYAGGGRAARGAVYERVGQGSGVQGGALGHVHAGVLVVYQPVPDTYGDMWFLRRRTDMVALRDSRVDGDHRSRGVDTHCPRARCRVGAALRAPDDRVAEHKRRRLTLLRAPGLLPRRLRDARLRGRAGGYRAGLVFRTLTCWASDSSWRRARGCRRPARILVSSACPAP